ncbi:hypothetical protein ACEUZ9_004690 [Paracoccus litorisediminis]|uniref:hypothetical protein n=1 Tax=Paracoccus litorisediminis TaxID=2006130 RepID=UPI00372F0A77
MRSRKQIAGPSRAIRAVLTAALMSTAMTGMAHADWTKDVLDARCAEERRDRMSEDLRKTVDASVRRAEASILPPTPVGDLGCLNDLMTLPLDTFSSIGGLLGSLTSGLGGFDASGLDLDIDVASMVCGVAAEKWATLTTGLDASSLSLDDFASGTGIRGLVPGMSGASSLTASQSSGRIENYTTPNTGISETTASLPIYPAYDDVDYDPSATAAYDYSVDMQKNQALARYVGCHVARNLDGTTQSGGSYGYGVWNTSPNSDDCSYDPGYIAPPVMSSSASQDAVVQAARASSEAAANAAPMQRSYGQTVAAPAQANGSTVAPSSGNAVWDSLGK